MAQDITWLGNEYLAVPEIYLPKSSSGEAKFTDVSDTTAAAADVASGKYFYTADGTKTAGTSSGGGSGAYAWFGENAEKVGTVITKTINLSTDTSYDSWQASTTATTIKAASSTADYSLSNASGEYDYCFLTRWFVQPAYFTGTTLKSTAYRFCAYYAHAFYGSPDRSTIASMRDGTPIGTSVNSYNNSANAMPSCYYYYSSSGTIAAYSTAYGPAYTNTTPSYSITASNGKLNMSITLPAILARCNSTRFATSMKTAVDSANTNIYITTDLIRCPRGKSFGSAQFEMLRADLNAT